MGCKFGADGEFETLGDGPKRRFRLGDAVVWDVHGEWGEDGEGQYLGKALMLKRQDVEEVGIKI